MSSTGPLSELESLRLQVAELTRTLAERDQVRQDGPEQANLLRAIVEGTSADIGVEFLRSFVKHLAQSLHVRFAFVGEWREQTPGKVNTLAVWSGTDFAEPFEYDLQGSPCEHVIGKALCLHESDVQERFPDDQLLVQLEVQSYCGMPLFDQSGTPLGLLVVMDDRPFTRPPHQGSVASFRDESGSRIAEPTSRDHSAGTGAATMLYAILAGSCRGCRPLG